MKELDELRRVAGGRNTVIGAEIYKLCDAIERELAERWMELPVDADGVPIHVGDRMIYSPDKNIALEGIRPKTEQKEVSAVGVQCFFTDGNKHMLDAWYYRHAKPDTVEDVLRDLVEEWGACDSCDPATERQMLARYAGRIMEVARDD